MPESLNTPEKRALMAKAQTECAPDLSTDEMRRKFPESARLRVTLIDGTSAYGFCGIAHGMPENPLSDEDVLKKFGAALAFSGRDGNIETRLGDNPANAFARIMA